MFTQGGKINFNDLPGAFLGALGIKGISDMSNRDLNDDVLDKLKKNPDALDDAQKAMLLKRVSSDSVIIVSFKLLTDDSFNRFLVLVEGRWDARLFRSSSRNPSSPAKKEGRC
jgi:hypothetical protein